MNVPRTNESGTITDWTEWLADLLAGQVPVVGVQTEGDELRVEVRDIDGGPSAGTYLLWIESEAEADA